MAADLARAKSMLEVKTSGTTTSGRSHGRLRPDLTSRPIDCRLGSRAHRLLAFSTSPWRGSDGAASLSAPWRANLALDFSNVCGRGDVTSVTRTTRP